RDRRPARVLRHLRSVDCSLSFWSVLLRPSSCHLPTVLVPYLRPSYNVHYIFSYLSSSVLLLHVLDSSVTSGTDETSYGLCHRRRVVWSRAGRHRERPGGQARAVRHLPPAGSPAGLHHRQRPVPDRCRPAALGQSLPSLRGLPRLGLADSLPVLGGDGDSRPVDPPEPGGKHRLLQSSRDRPGGQAADGRSGTPALA